METKKRFFRINKKTWSWDKHIWLPPMDFDLKQLKHFTFKPNLWKVIEQKCVLASILKDQNGLYLHGRRNTEH